MSDPNLKPLQLEAATAFAVLKYMSVAPDNVGDVVDILIESSSLHHSHARAAALVYQQVTRKKIAESYFLVKNSSKLNIKTVQWIQWYLAQCP